MNTATVKTLTALLAATTVAVLGHAIWIDATLTGYLTIGNSVRWAPPRVDLTPTPEVDQATALGLPVDDRWLTDRDAA